MSINYLQFNLIAFSKLSLHTEALNNARTNIAGIDYPTSFRYHATNILTAPPIPPTLGFSHARIRMTVEKAK